MDRFEFAIAVAYYVATVGVDLLDSLKWESLCGKSL